MRIVAGEVFADEASALGAGREDVVVAVETAPFGEVVGDVEGGRGGGGVLVVDEFDGFHVVCGWFAAFFGRDYEVAAEQIAVTED